MSFQRLNSIWFDFTMLQRNICRAFFPPRTATFNELFATANFPAFYKLLFFSWGFCRHSRALRLNSADITWGITFHNSKCHTINKRFPASSTKQSYSQVKPITTNHLTNHSVKIAKMRMDVLILEGEKFDCSVCKRMFERAEIEVMPDVAYAPISTQTVLLEMRFISFFTI